VLEKVICDLEQMTHLSPTGSSDCHRSRALQKGAAGKEVKAMCQCCCQKPEKLKGKPEECTPQQIKDCHGDVENHPCAGEKKEGK
jgi:hypothetical protein